MKLSKFCSLLFPQNNVSPSRVQTNFDVKCKNKKVFYKTINNTNRKISYIFNIPNVIRFWNSLSSKRVKQLHLPPNHEFPSNYRQSDQKLIIGRSLSPTSSAQLQGIGRYSQTESDLSVQPFDQQSMHIAVRL